MSKKDKEQEKIYEVPEEGSLGLLALGDLGLKAWREKMAVEKAKEEKQKDNKKEDE